MTGRCYFLCLLKSIAEGGPARQPRLPKGKKVKGKKVKGKKVKRGFDTCIQSNISIQELFHVKSHMLIGALWEDIGGGSSADVPCQVGADVGEHALCKTVW